MNKKHVKILAVIIGIALLGMIVSYYAFAPIPNFKRQSIKIAVSEIHSDAVSFGLNTFDNAIGSQDIIALVYFCDKNISQILHQDPEISSWEDEMGYPGLSLVWQSDKTFIAVWAFYANDNDSIHVMKGNGRFGHKIPVKNIKKCSVQEIEHVIDQNRCKTWL